MTKPENKGKVGGRGKLLGNYERGDEFSAIIFHSEGLRIH